LKKPKKECAAQSKIQAVNFRKKNHRKLGSADLPKEGALTICPSLWHSYRFRTILAMFPTLFTGELSLDGRLSYQRNFANGFGCQREKIPKIFLPKINVMKHQL